MCAFLRGLPTPCCYPHWQVFESGYRYCLSGHGKSRDPRRWGPYRLE